MNLGVVRRALTSPSPSPSERATADETGDADHVDVDIVDDVVDDVVDEVCTHAVGRLKRLMDSRWSGRFVVGLLLFSVAEGWLLWNTWSATGVVSEQFGTRIKANTNSNTNSNNNSNNNSKSNARRRLNQEWARDENEKILWWIWVVIGASIALCGLFCCCTSVCCLRD